MPAQAHIPYEYDTFMKKVISHLSLKIFLVKGLLSFTAHLPKWLMDISRRAYVHNPKQIVGNTMSLT